MYRVYNKTAGMRFRIPAVFRFTIHRWLRAVFLSTYSFGTARRLHRGRG